MSAGLPPIGDAEDSILPSDFRTKTSSLAAADRRTEPRTECTRTIGILPLRPGALWTLQRADMFDCSPHGLGLLTDQVMVVGDTFLAKLRLEKLLFVAYEVRHCVRVGTRYKIGAWMTGLIGGPGVCDPVKVFDALLRAEP